MGRSPEVARSGKRRHVRTTPQGNSNVRDLHFEPKYEDFRPRTIWSLSDAFTSAFKAWSRSRSSRRRRSGVNSWRYGSHSRFGPRWSGRPPLLFHSVATRLSWVLEKKLCAQLNETRRIGTHHLPESGTADIAVDGLGSEELCVVENIETLQPKL